MIGASFLRRLLMCPMGLSQTFRPRADDTACWGECDLCGRRAGETSRKDLRGYITVEGATEGAWEAPELHTIAPSLDAVPDSLEKPLIGYLSKNGHRIFSENDDWSTMICRDKADLNPKGGVVEVEIRVLRVIPEGAR